MALDPQSACKLASFMTIYFYLPRQATIFNCQASQYQFLLGEASVNNKIEATKILTEVWEV